MNMRALRPEKIALMNNKNEEYEKFVNGELTDVFEFGMQLNFSQKKVYELKRNGDSLIKFEQMKKENSKFIQLSLIKLRMLLQEHTLQKMNFTFDEDGEIISYEKGEGFSNLITKESLKACMLEVTPIANDLTLEIKRITQNEIEEAVSFMYKPYVPFEVVRL